MNQIIESIEHGKNYLNNQYDYHNAIQSFLTANTLCINQPHTNELDELVAQINLGLAMSYHNIGKFHQRDLYLKQVQIFLNMPDNVNEFNTTSPYTEIAAGYCVVNGYKFYIYFEHYKKMLAPLATQETMLLNAKESFLKAIEITNTVPTGTECATHAQHGLGTVFEFLSACEVEKNNYTRALEYALKSIDGFLQALEGRVTLLGADHILVARSDHKLARSYAHYCTLLNHCAEAYDQSIYQTYVALARRYYEQAIQIYDTNKIAPNHAKYKELLNDYEAFKHMFK